MAVFQAFRGIRPAEKNASLIAELPYDVYNTAEARARVVDRPLSFLHIDRPEINFPEGMSPYTPIGTSASISMSLPEMDRARLVS